MSGHQDEQRDFHHPYKPYPIQLDFMNALYDAIETGSIGIFESPTGTVFGSQFLAAPTRANVVITRNGNKHPHEDVWHHKARLLIWMC